MRSWFVLQVLLVGVLVASACADDTASTTVVTTAPATTSAPATTRAAAATTATTQAPATTAAPTTTATTQAPATTAAPTTTVAASTSGLQIIQVGFDTSFQEGWVLLQNTGNTPWNLTGHYLCQRPSYFALPDVTIPAGDIYWVGIGVDHDAPGVGANGAVGTFDPDGGEVGLYSSSSFGDANAILSYVEWGSTGHGRSSVAVAAGIWEAGDFVTVPSDLTGAISVFDSAAPPGAANWFDIEAP